MQETEASIVHFNKISTPTPWMVIGICKGVGDLKGQNFKGKYEAKMEFLGGWGRVLKPKKSSKGGEGVDIILEQHIRHWIQGVVPLKHIYPVVCILLCNVPFHLGASLGPRNKIEMNPQNVRLSTNMTFDF